MQSLAVLHHGFDAVGVQRTGKPFVRRLDALEHRHGHPALREVGVDVEHLACFCYGFFGCFVGSVALLPEEFSSAQEQTRAHFPAHHVGPLVHQQRQIAVTLDPILVGVPNDGLGRRPYDEFLLQLRVGIDHHATAVFGILEAVVRDDRTFLCKAFHVIRLLREVALGNEKREVRIDVAGVLEHLVQHILHALPYGKPVRLNDHAALDVAVLSEVGLHHQFVVPLAVIRLAGSQF